MKKLLLHILFLVSLFTEAQEVIPFDEIEVVKPISQYSIEGWNMNNGLPSNAIMDIQKTSEGFMWLATFNGLARFDGTEFKVFNRTNTPEFFTNTITTLLVDSQDRLWIGNGGGLIRYYQGSFERIETEAVNTNIISALAEGPEGVLWIGTRSGLIKLQNQQFEAPTIEGFENVNITSLFHDEKQRLWIGTATRGLHVLDENGLFSFNESHGLQSDFIRSVFVDSKDIVWVGTDQGVSILNGTGIHRMDSVPGAPLGFTNRFLEDSEGNIWSASSDGLRRYKQRFELADPAEEVGHQVVQSLFQDEENNIWAGTYRVGLHRLNQSKFMLLGENEGLSNQVINVTYPDNPMLWVGSDDGLICFKEGQMKTFDLGRVSAGNRIRDILRDSQDRLWICTYGGLLQFDDGGVNKRYTTNNGLCSNNTRRIIEDAKGDLWIGTANGLSRFKDGKFETFGPKDGLRNNFIMSLLIDQNQTLWVGTNGGGTYRFEDNRFIKAMSDEAAHDVVFNMLQDDTGGVWLSTNRGVIYLKDSMKFNITPTHGLISNNVFQIIIEQTGQIWFTSDNGIMRSTIDQVMNLVFGISDRLGDARIFDRSDGLRTGQITAASIAGRTNKGEIWFCTLEGLAVLESSKIPINEVRANTLLTIVQADDQQYPIAEDATLPAGNQRIEFHYAGLSFYAPEKVRYKYILENFDQNWIDAGSRRTAYYTNIPPGEYRFKVKAANNDGLWSEAPATIYIEQAAFFYETKWFYFLIGLILIGFGAFLYYLRARELKSRNYQLEKMVHQRTRDIQYQNQAILVQREELQQLNTVKDKLLSVISHDLRGPIAAVSGLLGLLKSGHLTHTELITQSSRLNNEVHSLTYLLDNMLSWSKSQMQGIKLNKENILVTKVVEENINTVLPLSTQKRIAIINQVEPECYVFTDVNFLSLVIRNLIMNAVKFTHQNGEIHISTNCSDGKVLISVTDNGVGMSKSELKKLFNTESHYSKMGTANEAGTGIGLLLCKEFIELEGGKIWAESEEGKGSSFKLILDQGSPHPANADAN